MKFLIALFAVLFLLLQYKLLFQSDSVIASIQLHREVVKEQKVNDQLSERNQKLVAKIYDLQHTKASTEALAREHIGMIKPGEQYYQFVKTEK